MVQGDRKFKKPTSVLEWLCLWSRPGLSEPEAVGVLLYAASGLTGTAVERSRLQQTLGEIAEAYAKTNPLVSSIAREAMVDMAA